MIWGPVPPLSEIYNTLPPVPFAMQVEAVIVAVVFIFILFQGRNHDERQV